jgi:hypothetical protein
MMNSRRPDHHMFDKKPEPRRFSKLAPFEDWWRWFREEADHYLSKEVLDMMRSDFEKKTDRHCPERISMGWEPK